MDLEQKLEKIGAWGFVLALTIPIILTAFLGLTGFVAGLAVAVACIILILYLNKNELIEARFEIK